LKAGQWRGFTEHQYVLWGPPLLELGNVGAMMCVFPNNEDLGKWDCSAPGGKKNVNEDFWIVKNYSIKTGIPPVFNPNIVGIIRPTPQEIYDLLDITVPDGFMYEPQPNWDGRP
jgi:hypothetical protein